jgi:hypothetical protein
VTVKFPPHYRSLRPRPLTLRPPPLTLLRLKLSVNPLCPHRYHNALTHTHTHNHSLLSVLLSIFALAFASLHFAIESFFLPYAVPCICACAAPALLCLLPHFISISLAPACLPPLSLPSVCCLSCRLCVCLYSGFSTLLCLVFVVWCDSVCVRVQEVGAVNTDAWSSLSESGGTAASSSSSASTASGAAANGAAEGDSLFSEFKTRDAELKAKAKERAEAEARAAAERKREAELKAAADAASREAQARAEEAERLALKEKERKEREQHVSSAVVNSDFDADMAGNVMLLSAHFFLVLQN